MEEWKEYRLGDLIEEIAMGPFGSNIKVDCFVDFGIPVLNGSNLQGFKLNENSFNYVTEEKADSLGRANTFRGDIVITHRGTLGQIIFIPEDSKYDRYVISQSQFRVKFKKDIDSKYIVYFFHSKKGQQLLLSNASQVGVPAIARPSTSFKELKAVLPPLPEQKKIVAILSSLDEKIETNRKINAKLEELAQAIFKSWFIDFEPFGGKMPEDWGLGKLADLISITSGKRPVNKTSEKSTQSMYPIIGASSIMGYTTNYLYDESILIIGRVGTLGVVQKLVDRCWPSDNTLVIKSKYFEFIYHTLKNIEYNSLNRGSTQPLITQSEIKNFELILPSIEIIEKFEILCSPIYKMQLTYQKESANLASLRDALLPKLMSGEIKV